MKEGLDVSGRGTSPQTLQLDDLEKAMRLVQTMCARLLVWHPV
jgi:hypothetical protein